MNVRKVLRYYADCGRAFWKKQQCVTHEQNCKCWTNPKFKTCMTCKFRKQYQDSNGMEREPQFLQTWTQRECTNDRFNEFEPHLKVAHENAPDLYINCPLWESKIETQK